MNSAAATAGINARQRSARTHRIVRQLHLWIGAWGAIAAILYGISGFVMNHRAVLKIPQGGSTDLSKIELPVPGGVRTTPEAMRTWLRDTQKLDIDNLRVMPSAPIEFNGQTVKPPARWMFSGGNARVTTQAEYSEGNASMIVRQTEQSPLATLLRLHKSVGGGIAWTLLGDTFAFSMIALGISGLLLWGRGRSVKQMVFSVVGVATVVLLLIGGAAVI
ncbi:MAG: PepSY-associated TM helix domain-containing protein [Rudaea sp.]|uniref:PepSY-associated TM helix domain-containing protein n=1 Tax=unclassified Rudaea TaxID=2627037 RepID=UPI0010F742AE|nr:MULTISPECIES: PepSY-associated TM helix domain-containing protein [unclassified Rudaea]MBN8886404.1 PepSY-associated TM helix domain-containing protein [Rudaea sp.]MBR0346295.1 PepSY-associated TM helix domain-containing protein [Rudaea sp.]